MAAPFKCPICYDTVDESKSYQRPVCNHKFCLPCFQDSIEDELTDRRDLLPRCPGRISSSSRCSNGYTEEEISFLAPKKLAEFQRISVLNQIPPSDRVYCPYPNCSGITSKDTEITNAVNPGNQIPKVLCAVCGKHYCLACRVPWHHGVTCEEASLSLVDNEMGESARFCPGCNQGIEKLDEESCQHVVCVCGTHFCYTCGEAYDDVVQEDGGVKHVKSCVCDIYDFGSGEGTSGEGETSGL